MRARWNRFRAWAKRELSAHLSPAEIFWACFLGIFVGCTPFWGLHLVGVIVIARTFKLNQPIMLFTVGISNPIFAPPLLAFEGALGRWMMGRGFRLPDIDLSAGWSGVAADGGVLFLQLTLGSFVVGPVLGALTGAFAVWLRRAWRHEPADADDPANPAVAEAPPEGGPGAG